MPDEPSFDRLDGLFGDESAESATRHRQRPDRDDDPVVLPVRRDPSAPDPAERMWRSHAPAPVGLPRPTVGDRPKPVSPLDAEPVSEAREDREIEVAYAEPGLPPLVQAGDIRAGRGMAAPSSDQDDHDEGPAVADIDAAGAGTEREADQDDDASGIRVSLWGGPSSGKTTFLAALYLAAAQSEENTETGSWSLIPQGDVTEQFQTKMHRELVGEYKFPASTDIQARYAWKLRGTVRSAAQNGRGHRFKRQAASRDAEFTLRVPDLPGEWYRLADKEGESGLRFDTGLLKNTRLVEEVASSDALLYLFDPVAELEKQAAFDYFHAMLIALTARVEQQKRFVGRYLPHYLAVCVTKFDDPQIFKLASDAHLLSNDRHGQPCVADKDAEEFFKVLCESTGRAEHVRQMLRIFAPDRTRYFVSSSIGFRRAEQSDYDPADRFNVHLVNGKQKIRGSVRPINILEPIIAMERMVSEGRGA